MGIISCVEGYTKLSNCGTHLNGDLILIKLNFKFLSCRFTLHPYPTKGTFLITEVLQSFLCCFF